MHRPRYDDWSLPKGKCEPGESYEDCARREVHEETGLQVELGDPLPEVRYRDHKDRPKVVRYWVMRPLGSGAAVRPERRGRRDRVALARGRRGPAELRPRP